MHILAKNPLKQKNTSFPMPCFLHLAWGSCELLLGGTEEVSTCRAAQKCHRENLKTWQMPLCMFETILVIYPSICTAQSLGKNGGAHCLCMRCLAVTGTSPRDSILRLNIPILLFNNESLLHVSCSVFVQLSISESYDTSSHKLS